MFAVVLKCPLRDALVFPYSISQNPSQQGMDLDLRRPRAMKGYWLNLSSLAFEGWQP